MLVDLYLLKGFNNYFNRRIKLSDTLTDYTSGRDIFVLEDTNFNPNDYISANHIIGSSSNPYNKSWNPDYVLEVDPSDNTIIRRWFVIEFIRKMNGQYQMILKRDVVADNYEEVINSPTYIEKATLNQFDEMIVNSEGMSFNQIKSGEYQLQDETRSAWAVIYLNKKRDANWSVSFKIDEYDVDAIDIINDPNYSWLKDILIGSGDTPQTAYLTDLIPSYAFGEGFFRKTAMRFTAIDPNVILNNKQDVYVAFKNTHQSVDIVDTPDSTIDRPLLMMRYNPSASVNYPFVKNLFFKMIYDSSSSRTLDYLKTTYNLNGGINYDVFNKIQKLINENKKIKINNTIYNLTFTEEEKDFISNITLPSSFRNDFFTDVEEVASEFGGQYILLSDADLDRITFHLCTRKMRLSVNQEPTGTKTITISKDGCHTRNAPYDIICLPMSQIDIINPSASPVGVGVHNPDWVMSFIRTLQIGGESGGVAWGGSNVYDVQILPFCPLQNIIGNKPYFNHDIDITKVGVENYNYDAVKTGSTIINFIIFYVQDASQTLNITNLYDTINKEYKPVPLCCKINDRKIDNECDLWRLVSPNYEGSFDFNLSKIIALKRDFDIGRLEFFNVDITYRPYQPYIHINPDFEFLYGVDYDDSRGLICGGDFSLSAVSDQWTEYMINNKNFQNTFNRELDSLEVNRTIQREKETFNITQSALSSSVSIAKGVIGGGLKGGVGGAIAGGVVGGISAGLNIASNVKQADWNERAYEEIRDYKIDMFNFNLENIQARPYSITRSSTISYNFKKFPILEYYTCTEGEKKALRDKLKYNGMTVMRIGTISDFISDTEERFVKGQIIRLDNIADDSHLLQDIFNEVNKGLFFCPMEVNDE